MIIAQIETARGLENVEAIAAVDGIDALWIGQFDLTTSLGIPGQFDHPDFHRGTDRVVEACRRQGKAAVLARPRATRRHESAPRRHPADRNRRPASRGEATARRPDHDAL
jgi:2-keto-3-deoxy-L-rhamnonate aldolase RhmA